MATQNHTIKDGDGWVDLVTALTIADSAQWGFEVQGAGIELAETATSAAPASTVRGQSLLPGNSQRLGDQKLWTRSSSAFLWARHYGGYNDATLIADAV